MRQYIALIHKDADSDYGVSFPDLPGCVTAGVDLDDARRMAEEALALHLEGMEEDHEPIPEPSSLEAVMADQGNRSGVVILVKAPEKAARTVRVNVTMPEDDLERIDRFANEHGYTRSGFLLRAAKREMDEDGEIREVTMADLLQMNPDREVMPELIEATAAKAKALKKAKAVKKRRAAKQEVAASKRRA